MRDEVEAQKLAADGNLEPSQASSSTAIPAPRGLPMVYGPGVTRCNFQGCWKLAKAAINEERQAPWIFCDEDCEKDVVHKKSKVFVDVVWGTARI